MNFHPDDFVALSLAVEAEGGSLLEEPCSGKEFRLKVPNAAGRMAWKRFHTTHCDMSALMGVPYDAGLHIRLQEEDDNYVEPITIVDHKGEQGGRKQAIVCAVDDCVGLWPRYAAVVSNRSYQKL